MYYYYVRATLPGPVTGPESCAAMCHVAVGSISVPKAACPGKVRILRRRTVRRTDYAGMYQAGYIYAATSEWQTQAHGVC